MWSKQQIIDKHVNLIKLGMAMHSSFVMPQANTGSEKKYVVLSQLLLKWG